MRTETLQQWAVVTAGTAEELTEQLNRKLRDLSGKNPTVTFDGLTAYIKYSECTRHPECLADEYEMRGVFLYCSQCPEYIPRSRQDGGPDRRCKKGSCSQSEYGVTFGRSQACDVLYELIRKGKVRLCYSE